jgi:phasin family protein
MATKPKSASTAPASAPVPAPVPATVHEPDAAAPAEAVTPAAEPVAASAPVPVAVAAPEAAPAVRTQDVKTTTVHVKLDMEKVVKTAEEFVAFGQGNVEAFVKSGQIWVAGVQDLSKQVAANAQAQFDETMSCFKAMTTVKSLKDMFELQSAFAKSALEKTMSESGKLTDASLKLTEQALAPITARVTTAVETFSKAA